MGPKERPYSPEFLLRWALSIRTRLLGVDDLSVADVLEALANRISYDFPAAEAEFRRALDIRRRHPDDRDLRLLADIVGLASLYSVHGHQKAADALFDEALQKRGYTPAGVCRPGDDELFSKLGFLKYNEGYYDEAEHDSDIAIGCVQRALGPDHVELVDELSLRIMIWRAQGRYAEAEQLARQGLKQRRDLHGEDSPAVDNALHHLAEVQYERGKLAAAAQAEAASLALRAQMYGRLHDSVAGSLRVLGDIHVASGDAATAAAEYREAIAIWQQTMGADHPYVGQAMQGLAEALVAQGRRDDARAVAEDALALQYRRLRPEHPAIASTLAVLATIERVESPEAAEPMFRDALAIRRKALGQDHPDTARAESLLGECLALQSSKLTEARPLLDHGAQILRERLGRDHRESRLAEKRRQRFEPG
jgi:tetratricopeptide (TPR) repeat protein